MGLALGLDPEFALEEPQAALLLSKSGFSSEQTKRNWLTSCRTDSTHGLVPPCNMYIHWS